MSSMGDPYSELNTAEGRTGSVIRILREEISIDQAADEYHVPVVQVEAWKQEFLGKATEAIGSLSLDQASELSHAAQSSRGIWVCSLGQDPLVPCLFIQASSAGRLPVPAVARWTKATDPPRQLAKSTQLTLLHGVSDVGAPDIGRFHLFASQAATAGHFERHTNLTDWELPVPVAGIVLLLHCRKKNRLVSRIFDSSRHAEDRTTSWARRQDLPCVVGALGLPPDDFIGDELLDFYGLPADLPLVVGKPPLRRRLQGRRRSASIGNLPHGSLTALFGVGDLVFDPECAKRILTTLAKGID